MPNRTPYVKDGIDDAVVHGAAGRGQPGAGAGRRSRRTTRSTIAPGRDGDGRCCGSPSERHGRAVRRTPSEVFATAAARRPTRFYAAARRRALQRRRATGPAAGVRRAALEQAVLPLRRRAAGSTATRPGRRRRRRASTAATATGGTSTTPTSSRCPTTGSTPGTPPGTSPSTASRWRWSIPTSPRSSSLLLLREWYMHPNGQLPAYEWAFGDVNPPVHAWAAWRVYKIEKRLTGHGRPRLPGARLPQAAAQLHLVGQPQGQRGPQRLPGRLPGPGQHRRLRPQRRRCRPAATWSRPTAPPGWACSASTCWRSRWSWPARTRSTRTSPPSSSSTSCTSPGR